MTPKRVKKVAAYSPDAAEKAAVSSKRVNEEVMRVNKALALGKRTVSLTSTDEKMADLLIEKYKSSGWRRVSSMWISKRLCLLLNK